MKQSDFLKKIKELDLKVFTKKDLGRLFPDDKYLDTSISRLLKSQAIDRLARGFYTLAETGLEPEQVATRLYYPSYISFESALAKYGVINQGPVGLTLATTRHSKKMRLGPIDCQYRRLKPNLFFGFNLTGGTYLAEPEKAVLDTLYLAALGKKKVDPTEWDLSTIDPHKLKKQAELFGKAVERAVSALLSRPAS